MWLLTIEDDEGAVSHHALSGERCTVGRAPDRDIVLSQANISRRHARLERRGESWQIVDEGSDNGTFVNGRAVDAATPVGVDDALQLGGYRLLLSVGEPVRELPPPPPPLTPARLLVIAGLSVGVEYTIERHDFVTIGSSEGCSLRLEHENIAALHATIRTLPGGRYELCDRSKTGLLFINGHPLVGEQVLEGGDAINVGGVALVRFLEPSQWPDPRFDMVSNPDNWLSVELAPPDDRPTLEEVPDGDEPPRFDASFAASELLDSDLVPVVVESFAPAERAPPSFSPTPLSVRAPGAFALTPPSARAPGAFALTPPSLRAPKFVPPASPSGRASGAVPSGPPSGRVAGPPPPAPPSGRVAGPSPPAPPSGRVAGPSPPAPPSGRVAGPVPPAPPSVQVAGAHPPAPPSGRVAGAAPPALPSGRVAGAVPPAPPSGRASVTSAPALPAPPAGRASGPAISSISDERISGTNESREEAEGEDLPVSSRRKMLATLRRLASW